MRPKKIGLAVQSVLHALLRVDILLTTIYDTNETQLQRVNATGQNVQSVGARVHQVEFREHADRASTLGIYRPSELERFRIR